jgi:hypothetical protein
LIRCDGGAAEMVKTGMGKPRKDAKICCLFANIDSARYRKTSTVRISGVD